MAAGLAAIAVTLVIGPTSPAKAADRQAALYGFKAEGGGLHTVRGSHREFVLKLRSPRAMGGQKLRGFIRDWKRNGFRRNPPSAAVVIRGASDDHDVQIVELRHPRLLRGGDVGFRAQADKADGALERFADDADRRLDPRFGEARLFIDPTRSVDIIMSFFNLPPEASTARFAATFTNASFAAPGKQGYTVIAGAPLRVDFRNNQLLIRNPAERYPTDGVLSFTMTTQDPFIAGSVTNLPGGMFGQFSAGSEGPVPLKLGAFKLSL
jgi:hypothetical protein